MLLIERYQPCLGDPAIGDAVDARRTRRDLAAAQPGATVGELDERLLVVRLASSGDPDRPACEISPKTKIPHHGVAAQ